jgi:hypothetical protein
MFSIFKKPSKIYVDCFTEIEDLPILFPVLNAADRLPTYWKNLATTCPHEGVQRGTMKTCPGVSDLYRTGMILQTWCDTHIDTGNNKLEWMPPGAGESHDPKQWGDSFKNHYHLKLISPWRFKEVVINMHVIDKAEMEKMHNWVFTFNGHYFKRKKLLKAAGK